MTLDNSVIAVIISGALTLAGIIYTQRQARAAAQEANEIQDRKVDAEAYERARKFDQEVVAGLRAEVERLNTQLEQLRRALQQERDDNFTLRNEVVSLQRTVDRMRRILIAADVQLPDELLKPGQAAT